MNSDHLKTAGSGRCGNISNMAFGGPDLRTGYLGCLLCDHILKLPLPVAGQALAHWNVDLGPLAL